MKIPGRFGLLAAALSAAAILFAPLMFYKTPISKADGPGKRRLKPAPGAAGKYVITQEAGETVCRNATEEESLNLFNRSSDLELKPISPISPNQSGFKIILRGTNQLNSFPQAKSAFIKAAARWEAIIASPITMIIDVDFGPRRFGQTYPSGVLGSTLSQEIAFAEAFPDIRERLIDLASNNAEMALYDQLPQEIVPTDIGSTNVIAGASALFRALEFLDPVADPDGQEANLGAPPSIGFNSAFEFDFNPDDGISFNTFDFDAVAVHEIGHALGFNSNAGDKEAFPSSRLSLTLWDIFRFRPDAGKGFTTAPRILSTSGDQVFFVNEIDELALSTGGPFGAAGDGFQSSHWKSRNSGGGYIGIMDPAIPQGSRSVITKNDIIALDYFGYQIRDRIMPNFRLNLTPASQTIIPGESATFTIDLLESGGFSSAVNLSVSVTPTDASVAASLSTAAISPGGSAALTVSTTANTPSSTFTITIRGASGQLVKTKTAAVTVSKTNFTLSLDPAQASVNPASSTAFTIGAQGVGGFTGTIGVSASISPSNAGITATLSATSITPGGLAILTVNAAATTPIANYVVTVTGRSGQLTRTATGTLVVGGGGGGNFSLSLNPAQVIIARGEAAPFTIGVQGSNGFSSPVDLSIAIGPSDGTVSATLSTTTVAPGGTAALTVNTSGNTPLSTFTITVTGRSGQAARTATAMVIVSGPDFSLGFNPAQVTLTKKQKGQFTVNVNRISGFAGSVTVTPPDTKALKIKITQPSLSTTGASVSFDFKVKKTAASGTQQVTFTGRDSSGRVRTAALTIIIQ